MRVKKLHNDAILPTRGTPKSAGLDLYSYEEAVIDSLSNKKIGTGIAVAIPDGYVGLIFARSGLSVKKGLRPANCVGVIDSDYRGEIIVALYNDGTGSQTVLKGDRIAQLVIVPYSEVEPIIVNDLDDTERGIGGFGSTG